MHKERRNIIRSNAYVRMHAVHERERERERQRERERERERERDMF